ncbi:MAG: sensor domain-containing diguanylate cyclase [Cycloclasticus sp.]|nr:sensor domain-containing diguanylate cyclase [Cycloclasticus sp.]MBQ0789781.1 sensor domain-containing diguanylate cyclase [Cycloclasticus sp.]
MKDSYEFLKSVIDTIAEHVVVIDNEGEIVFVNNSWVLFGQQNACLINKTWEGVNYLKECDKAAAMGDDVAAKAGSGIRAVISGVKKDFYFEYPCHSPDEKRWFMMRVTPLALQGGDFFVLSHHSIVERKLIEEEMLNLSRIDGLTGIPNRRYFDEFLDNEWKRCNRLGLPISLAILDLDHFKLLNDTYGHQAGDDCLSSVGKVLKDFCKRPSDLCARYGGEEFVIVYGDTDLDQAKVLVSKLLKKIRSLNLPNEKSPTLPTLTASIGLASMHPSYKNTENDLIKQADKSLYFVKEQGRNNLSFYWNSQQLGPE